MKKMDKSKEKVTKKYKKENDGQRKGPQMCESRQKV